MHYKVYLWMLCYDWNWLDNSVGVVVVVVMIVAVVQLMVVQEVHKKGSCYLQNHRIKTNQIGTLAMYYRKSYLCYSVFYLVVVEDKTHLLLIDGVVEAWQVQIAQLNQNDYYSYL